MKPLIGTAMNSNEIYIFFFVNWESSDFFIILYSDWVKCNDFAWNAFFSCSSSPRYKKSNNNSYESRLIDRNISTYSNVIIVDLNSYT